MDPKNSSQPAVEDTINELERRLAAAEAELRGWQGKVATAKGELSRLRADEDRRRADSIKQSLGNDQAV